MVQAGTRRSVTGSSNARPPRSKVASTRSGSIPGLGVGKSLRDSVALLGRIDELVATGIPVAVATSRKRFVGALLAASDARAVEPALPGLLAPPLVEVADDELMTAPDDRIEGSLATAMFALVHGVALLRVHDVRATVNAVRLLTAEAA